MPRPDHWYAVKHPAIKGVTTYWRHQAEAEEHHDRLVVKYGKVEPITKVAEIPHV